MPGRGPRLKLSPFKTRHPTQSTRKTTRRDRDKKELSNKERMTEQEADNDFEIKQDLLITHNFLGMSGALFRFERSAEVVWLEA